MQIIENKLADGRIEYQVSDGSIGERSFSYDFDTLQEAVDVITQEVDMLADENKKMAEYLLYLHECNKIDLERDNLGWLL